MEIEYGGPSEIESELKKVQEYWLFSSLLMGGDGGRGMEGDWVVGWWVSVIYIVQLKLLCFSSLLFTSHYFVFCFHRIGLFFQFIFFDVGTQQLTHEHNNTTTAISTKKKMKLDFLLFLF